MKSWPAAVTLILLSLLFQCLTILSKKYYKVNQDSMIKYSYESSAITFYDKSSMKLWQLKYSSEPSFRTLEFGEKSENVFAECEPIKRNVVVWTLQLLDWAYLLSQMTIIGESENLAALLINVLNTVHFTTNCFCCSWLSFACDSTHTFKIHETMRMCNDFNPHRGVHCDVA